jgi:choline dehydrogenase-like flavoprotein
VLAFAPEQIQGAGENNSAIYLWAEPGDDSLLAGYGGHASLGFRAGEYWHYRVKVIVEPRPIPDSRLTLLNERDALGLRRVKLDWRIEPADLASAYRLVDALGEAVAGSGLGRLRIEQPNSEAVRAGVTGGCHHMGTLRMAARSEDGVVDPDLRVFGTRNLYVASSAVLPRYGYSNPTLTTVALSVRLARHLSGAQGMSSHA